MNEEEHLAAGKGERRKRSIGVDQLRGDGLARYHGRPKSHLRRPIHRGRFGHLTLQFQSPTSGYYHRRHRHARGKK